MNVYSQPVDAWRVIVAGFLDWPSTREMACGFDPYRCLENPSGRLLIGGWHDGGSVPDPNQGELPRCLGQVTTTVDGRRLDWVFDTLPVVWGVASDIDTSGFDAIVNIGYGVRDACDQLRVERHACNRRSHRSDSRGRVPDVTEGLSLSIAAADDLIIRGGATLDARIEAVSGGIDDTRYTAVVAEARMDNTFVCNETHAIMLKRTIAGKRLAHAYFIHIPKPTSDRGYPELARALASMITRLIQPERT